MKLESRERIKTLLEISKTNHDTILDYMIEYISQRIEKYLNRKLKKQEYTEYFNVNISRKRFSLKAYPIDLTEDFTASQYNVEDTINSDYYVYDEDGIVQYFTPRTHCNEPKCIKFVYTGGYEEVYTDGENVLDVPDDLKRACYMQVAFEFRRRRDLGLLSITTPDGSISKESAASLLPEVKNVLDSYKHIGGTYLRIV